MTSARQIGQVAVVVAVAAVAAVVGYALFVVVPGAGTTPSPLARLLGVVLTLGLVAGSLKLGTNAARTLLGTYNVAEVEVDDIITRDGGTPGPMGLSGVSANDIVEQIEAADEDRNADALVVTLNTPGGQVVPSEDIRRAAEQFDGPTVAYAEDMATSGGYWIASGADWFHAREGSMVGSIGVNGTQFGFHELADEKGIDYRRFVAGEYKDTPSPFRELSEEEVDYFQGLLDDWYDQFVDTVTAGRDLEEEFVRDTEARIYPGVEAAENGLVDHAGPREAMEDRLADELGVDEVEVEEFEPETGLTEKLSMGVRSVAMAFGAGLASAVVGDDAEPPVEAR